MLSARFLAYYIEQAYPGVQQGDIARNHFGVASESLSRWMTGSAQVGKWGLANIARGVCRKGGAFAHIPQSEFKRAVIHLQHIDAGKLSRDAPAPVLACPFLVDSESSSDNGAARPPSLPAPSQWKPRLTIDWHAEAGHHFSRRLLDVLGREQEQQTLRSFCSGDERFAWMQLAGAGGQGKSRLALELAIEQLKKGWSAGFLERDDLLDFVECGNEWQPAAPHLVIIDYLIGAAEAVGVLMRSIARRRKALSWPVRFLLLERQRWDRDGLELRHPAIGSTSLGNSMGNIGSGRAEWLITLTGRYDGNHPELMETRFDPSVLELQRLSSDHLADIVRRFARYGGMPFNLDNETIAGHLERIDRQGRPLYAYFLSETLLDGSFRVGWSREDLLDAVLFKDQRTRWAAAFGENAPFIGDNNAAMRLAVLATMVRGVDTSALEDIEGWERVPAATRRQAAVLTDAPIGSNPRGGRAIVPGLEPDLLGEWFALSGLLGLADSELISSAAWSINPGEMSGFLKRSAQDFPHHAALQSLLANVPTTEPARQSCAAVASSVLGTLWMAKAKVPEQFLDQLRSSAVSGDGRAMTNLGVCYFHGHGVARDAVEAAIWCQKGAAAGDGRAMANLGICYYRGDGVTRDLAEAVNWFRRGAAAGDARAMACLGHCYGHGEGVPSDPTQAVAWFRQGAAAGDARAMTNLGHCYYIGEVVSHDPVEAVFWFRRGAAAGDVRAMASLGVCYYQGDGVERDPTEAVGWFRKGAAAGDGRAMAKLGDCYYQGEGVAHDPGMAVEWYRRGVSTGYGKAMTCLGTCYYRGDGVERDPAQAVAWFRRGVAVGDGLAMSCLGTCFELGMGVERDVTKAVAWFQRGAAAGDGRAMACLGTCYYQGNGVECDHGEAVAWFRKGAATGNGGAMAELGLCYYRGKGVNQDLTEAVAWFRKGVAAGEGRAMTRLGVCCERGLASEPCNLAAAIYWYRRGAATGDGEAMSRLGVCYYRGEGVERSSAAAVSWFRKGAAVGDSRAMTTLGFCYEQGIGVAPDRAAAVSWYRKGAAAGDVQAMTTLGACYEHGIGVERDLEEAARWYRAAGEKGSDDGRERLAKPLDEMFC